MAGEVPKTDRSDLSKLEDTGSATVTPDLGSTVPRFKLISADNGIHHIEFEGKDEAAAVARLHDCLGSNNWDFVAAVIKQLGNLSAKNGKVDTNELNYLLAVFSGIGPRDQIEAMLATQIAAVHTATMTFALRLKNVETIPQQDSAEKTFNKLVRSFTNQMEALRKYRNGGEQKVTVQHVNVNEGGQAVVGNIRR